MIHVQTIELSLGRLAAWWPFGFIYVQIPFVLMRVDLCNWERRVTKLSTDIATMRIRNSGTARRPVVTKGRISVTVQEIDLTNFAFRICRTSTVPVSIFIPTFKSCWSVNSTNWKRFPTHSGIWLYPCSLPDDCIALAVDIVVTVWTFLIVNQLPRSRMFLLSFDRIDCVSD